MPFFKRGTSVKLFSNLEASVFFFLFLGGGVLSATSKSVLLSRASFLGAFKVLTILLELNHCELPALRFSTLLSKEPQIAWVHMNCSIRLHV